MKLRVEGSELGRGKEEGGGCLIKLTPGEVAEEVAPSVGELVW